LLQGLDGKVAKFAFDWQLKIDNSSVAILQVWNVGGVEWRSITSREK
jgi:hypothetical protein